MTTFSWSKRTDVPRTPKGNAIAQGYPCPECGAKTRVNDSRDAASGIRHRRVCTGQGEHRFTTYELTEDQLRALTDVPMLQKVSEILLKAVMEINSMRRRARFKVVKPGPGPKRRAA